jgi:DNA topoisomerase VI subunit A
MIQVLWIMINEKEMYCSKWYWFRDESGRNYLELFKKENKKIELQQIVDGEEIRVESNYLRETIHSHKPW